MLLTCAQCNAKNRVPAARLGDRPRCGRCKQPIAVDTPVVIGSASEFDELVGGSPLPVVVDFWADWCAPCRMVGPEIAKLAKQRAGRVVVAKLDTEAVPEVPARYGIQGIPAFIAFRGGREATRAVGAMPSEQLARLLGV
jgi:thioredoxin 2